MGWAFLAEVHLRFAKTHRKNKKKQKQKYRVFLWRLQTKWSQSLTTMAACLQLNVKPFSPLLSPNPVSTRTRKLGRISCSAASPSKRHTITLLPGDGIGPEVISVARNVLNLAASIEGSFNSVSFLYLFILSSISLVWFPRKERKIETEKEGRTWILITSFLGSL